MHARCGIVTSKHTLDRTSREALFFSPTQGMQLRSIACPFSCLTCLLKLRLRSDFVSMAQSLRPRRVHGSVYLLCPFTAVYAHCAAAENRSLRRTVFDVISMALQVSTKT